MATRTSTSTFTDPDGFEVFVYKWVPEGSASAVVQIAHGGVEHALRYERVARFLNYHDYIVYANDHRGHGKTAGTLERAGKAGDDGWNGIVRDFKQLTDIIKDENPGLPVFVLGHSLGSIVAQQYMEQYGDGVAGVILSGTFGTLGDTSGIMMAIDGAIASDGADAPSDVIAGMFGAFNERFGGDTGFEWLSRDNDEVRKYVDDPWCGTFPLSNEFVRDFFVGMDQIWLPENEAKIPGSLPVYIISGALDPAGGFSETAKVLVDRYEALGIEDLTVKFYPDARHEILNETNRDEVHTDIVEWLDAHTG
jgi:alpha-beta hydrolase superfamily lysophospholipase